MRILVVNDDGISAPGIKRLAQAANRFGEVWVVAPSKQCSAMSHRISIKETLCAKKYDIGVKNVTSYLVTGTPADCVQVALGVLMKDAKPDYIFSGVNNGYNAGYDIAYSGTVGAAMEGVMKGIPAIAFSKKAGSSDEILDAYLEPVIEELLQKELPKGQIWNVNFPGVSLKECNGILRKRTIANYTPYKEHYASYLRDDGMICVDVSGLPKEIPIDDSDLSALFQGYISIGTVKCEVM
ncbi:MAG: 5'/3'-nucleotidase SurE [Eubacterium sp.]|nr:5'/3'-nucleotidase SurE [Eubacterium sp.]